MGLEFLDNVALDRFLWLFGLWKRFQDDPSKINTEARRVFADPPADIMRRLAPFST
jgi:hypothetical protein